MTENDRQFTAVAIHL